MKNLRILAIARKWVKRALITSVSLFLIVYIILSIYVNYFVDIDLYEKYANKVLNERFALNLKIEDKSAVTLSAWLEPVIILKGAKITNMMGKELAKAEVIHLEMSLFKIINKVAYLKNLILKDAVISADLSVLDKYKNEKNKDLSSKAKQDSGFVFSFSNIELSKTKLTLKNSNNNINKSHTIEIDKLYLVNNKSNVKLDLKSNISKLPININANLYISRSVNQIDISNLQIDETKAKANLNIDNNKHRLKANISFDDLFLDDNLSKLNEIKNDLISSNNTKKRSAVDDPNNKLPLKSIYDWDIESTIKINRFINNKLLLKDLNISLRKSMEELALDAKNKELLAKIMYKIDKDNYALSTMSIDAKVFSLKDILHSDKNLVLKSAKGLTDIKISSKGDSAYSLLRNSRGKIKNDYTNLELSKEYSNNLDDIVSIMFYALLPDKNRSLDKSFECAVANFELTNGILKTNKGIGLESDDVAIQGNGTINLVSSAVSLTINPFFVNDVNVEQFNIIDIYKIGGTLSKPKLEIDSKASVKKGISIFSSIVKDDNFNKITSSILGDSSKDPNPCDTARKFG